MRTLLLHATRPMSIAALMLLFGCASQGKHDSATTKAAVEGVWKEYSASLNAGDLDRWLRLWTDDGVQMPPGEPAVIGKERIRARNAAFLNSFSFDIRITNEEVQTRATGGTPEASTRPAYIFNSNVAGK